MTDPTHIQQPTYLIEWRASEKTLVTDLVVRKFKTREIATTVGIVGCDDPRKSALVVDPSTDSMAGTSTAMLLAIFNAMRDPAEEAGEPIVNKFADRTVARNRFFARLEAKYGKLPATEAPAQAPAAGGDGPAGDAAAEEGGTTMPTSTKRKVRAAAGPKPERKRSNGLEPVAAGKASDLKTFRAGTIRANVLKAMNGTKTIAGVASAAGVAEPVAVSCIKFFTRDCGIGLRLDDGKVEAVIPGSKTIADLIAPAKS
jgi:hypothetical protein